MSWLNKTKDVLNHNGNDLIHYLLKYNLLVLTLSYYNHAPPLYSSSEIAALSTSYHH